MVFIPTDDGRWVSEDYERLARIIKDYDQSLELRWIPPENRTRDDKKPYVIVDVRYNQAVLYASELDTPEQILANLFMSDNQRGNVLTRLEAQENANKVFELRAKADVYEELADKAKFFKNSRLHTLKMDGKKFDENRRRVE